MLASDLLEKYMKHRCLFDRKNALSLIARYLLKAYCGAVVTLEKQLSLTADSSLSICGGI